VSLPLPTNKEKPMFDAWVSYIGYVRDPILLPGNPTKVVVANVYHVANKAELLQSVAQELGMMAMQQGMAVLRPEFEGKILDAEQLMSIESKMFVPMWNIRYIVPVIKPMTELPRVEEPGVPLTGQGVETKEHKPS
jgi:hypothetical protein